MNFAQDIDLRPYLRLEAPNTSIRLLPSEFENTVVVKNNGKHASRCDVEILSLVLIGPAVKQRLRLVVRDLLQFRDNASRFFFALVFDGRLHD